MVVIAAVAVGVMVFTGAVIANSGSRTGTATVVAPTGTVAVGEHTPGGTALAQTAIAEGTVPGIAPTTAPVATAQPGVGQTLSKDGSQVALYDYGLYEKFAKPSASTKAQGQLVVAAIQAKNLQNKTSNFTTNDLEIQASDKHKSAPSVGDTATIPGGFMISQPVQPCLTAQNRVVFDSDPAAKGLHLNVLGLQFALPA